MNRSYRGLYVPNMMLRELTNFLSGSVCLVLASDHYDEADYIRDLRRVPRSRRNPKMKVPFLDLAEATAETRVELDKALGRVLASGWYILGPEVEAFERGFAAYLGTDHCVGVGNGLDAGPLLGDGLRSTIQECRSITLSPCQRDLGIVGM